MKAELERLVADAIHTLIGNVLPHAVDPSAISVERTRDASHGDYACNIALRLARQAGKPPREIAEAIRAALPSSPLLSRAEVAGAGFINFYLAQSAQTAALAQVLEQAERYGRSTAGQGERILLEFVSANPTGPLHVGHGRQAAYGASLANLLRAVGYEVQREYYINDAGRQMDILTVSTWLRYLERCGQSIPFPANGYRGDYVQAIAARLLERCGRELERTGAEVFAQLPADAPSGDKELYIDALIERMRSLLGADGFASVLELSLTTMLAEIREDLAAFGVEFDRWYSERELVRSGAVEHALERLEFHGQLYRRDGAVWFRASRFGDDEDRVLVRANGQRTYFAPDIAYHLQKRERGFARLVDVLGADHHGYVARMRGALVAMGEPGECLEVCLIQFVSLFRGGEKLPMGKREAQFVTLRQLRQEVGNDACRLFYLMRSHDQPLDFDLELAKSRSNENPVYYLQYAHARVASVRRQLEARALPYDGALALQSLSQLRSPYEQAALASLARYPEVLLQAAGARAPHALVHYLRELATTFHSWYNAEPFIVEDSAQRNARLALAFGVQQVLRNGLALLGVSAPESM
ncbi:MAG TPA: arginine--tRNA ligase [Steroidobacteraceae bacterium]|nr:arginine--tRNA ligase [Steroidobacteraceae bacterium]